jgi:dimethylglycine dehydrogenase
VSERVRVVIIGGGIAGCSLAYHLTRLGWRDVVVLEKGELTSGSTWHAAGLCTQFTPSVNLTKLLKYSLDLYETLEAETGQAVSLHRNGSLLLATSPDKVDELHYRRSVARAAGLEVEIVSSAEAKELFPLLEEEGIEAAAFIPSDGYVDPSGVTHALAAGARSRGARFVRHTRVTGLERRCGEWIVRTTAGDFEAEVVVNAAGQWARQVGEMVGARLPVISLQHQYVVTAPVPDGHRGLAELPVLRDPEHSYYVREEGPGLLVGPFEPRPLPWALDGVPWDFGQKLLPANLEQIESVLEAAATRIPLLSDIGIRAVINGPDGYTPDGRCLMGEVPGLPGFHVLAGFSIFGIVFGGGAGRYAAEWIVDGQPSDNMWELDVRRFGEYASAKPYAVARAREVYEREYAIHYPHEELPAGRPLRTSPLYDRLASRGGVFGERSGWERPMWFATNGEDPVERYSFRRPHWLAPVVAECQRVRKAVGILDQTSFAKFEISGRGARAFLDRLCVNALPAQAGRIVLAPMCTERGGIECDMTVTQIGDDRFYLVSAAATEAHDLAWIQKHALTDGSVLIQNVTSEVGVLTLAGPRSRELLRRVSTDDFSNEAFPFLRSREIVIGEIPVRALRISYVGELGWELHHRLECQRSLYEALLDAGRDLGLIDFGYRALEAMRLEKGYRLWGSDITADWTPFEAGLDRFVKLGKGDFIGRAALMAQWETGVGHQLACLIADDGEAVPYHGEAVLDGDRVVSYVMSGGYGPEIKKNLAYSYLPTRLAKTGTELMIELLGQRVRAVVSDTPLVDPQNTRPRK